MGKKSAAQTLLEEFDNLRKREKESHLLFGALVKNLEDLFSKGLDAILKRIVCGKQGGRLFAELIDIALENAAGMHEKRKYPSYQPLKNNFEKASSILVEREKEITVGRTKGQQQRRLDFLVSTENDYYLGMEMKVETVDSRDQIAKYIDYLKTLDAGKGSYRGVLLYVTLDGSMPVDSNDEIKESDLVRVLPLSWSELAEVTKRHWEKIGKNYADFDAAMRFLDYVGGYAGRTVPGEIRNWVVDTIHDLDKHWATMGGMKTKEAQGIFLALQNAVLNILTEVYGRVDATIRGDKNMPESIGFDELRPKIKKSGFFSNPCFYESEWLDPESNNKADFYYYFSDGEQTKPTPPQALAVLMKGDPSIYLVSRFTPAAKTLRDVMDGKLDGICSGSIPRWKFGSVVRRTPLAKFTKSELKSGEENPKRTEQMKQFWKDHKKVLGYIAEM